MKRYIIYFLSSLFALGTFTSCEQEQIVTTFGDDKVGTLTLRLSTGGLKSRATIAGEDANNENLIKKLDCFLYNGNQVVYKPVTRELNGTDIHEISISFEENEMATLFGQDYQTNGNNKTCLIYVIANRPDNVTVTGSESIAVLKQKTLTGVFTNNATQANFVMDSDGTNDNDGNDVVTLKIEGNNLSLSGHVPLYRSAAKVGLFVHVPESIETGEGENKTTWTPVDGSMTVKFHKGVKKANIDNSAYPYDIDDADYFETEARSFDVATSTLQDSEGTTYNQTTSVPFYTYPTSTAEGQGTYFILYLSWQTGEGENIQYKNCSYQIPVNKLKALERNNYYRLLLHVGVLGTESGLVTLEPSYTVLDWNDEEINTSIEENVYLVVQEHDVTINNKNTYSVEFASSHKVEAQILSITQPYYKSNIAGTTIFCDYSEGQGKERIESGKAGEVYINNNKQNNVNVSLYKDCSVDVNGNTVVLNHEVVNMGEEETTNAYDIAPYTITVYVKMVYGTDANGNDLYFDDTIQFTQYPAIYVEAKQNSDYGNGGGENDDHNMMVNSYYTSQTNSNHQYYYTQGNNANTADKFGTAPRNMVAGGNTNINPNMYVIHITSMSDNTYTIGDPLETNVNKTFINSAKWATAVALYDNASTRKLQSYYRTDTSGNANPENSSNPNDYITGYVIAPIIRVASSYSVTHNTDDRDMAEKRCASYQEDGYPAGRWRMPTFAEAKFIYTLSWQEKIPALFNANTNYWCAHGDFVPNNGNVTLNPTGSASSIRCVYDEWYWGSEQITNKSQFTWGDYPREAWPQAATN